MVGDGDLRATAEREAARRGVKARLHGNLPHQNLPEMINAGRIFVLPSSYEGHPKTLLEAMACGAAVIGTDVPGIREVIEDGRTGLLCAPTAAALRDAIERLLSDRSEEHTSELQSLMRISYAVHCLKKKNTK